LLITHDMGVVAETCDRVAVMYLGKIVEIGDAETVAKSPKHPYTQALFSAALPSHPDERRDEIIVAGEVPSPLAPPGGCRFHPRCPFALPRCSSEEPKLLSESGRLVACHLYPK
jgi:oligopeptide/dipeptide ABC transporter ATP-binding protein